MSSELIENLEAQGLRHPDCKWDAEAEACGYGSVLRCTECKYGTGGRDPAAKRNQKYVRFER